LGSSPASSLNRLYKAMPGRRQGCSDRCSKAVTLPHGRPSIPAAARWRIHRGTWRESNNSAVGRTSSGCLGVGCVVRRLWSSGVKPVCQISRGEIACCWWRFLSPARPSGRTFHGNWQVGIPLVGTQPAESLGTDIRMQRHRQMQRLSLLRRWKSGKAGCRCTCS
jgi:hypothetical protein